MRCPARTKGSVVAAKDDSDEGKKEEKDALPRGV